MTFQPESFCLEPAFRPDNSLHRFCIPRVDVDEIEDLDWLVMFEMPARHVGLPGPVGRSDWKRIPRARARAPGSPHAFGARRRNHPRTGVPQMPTHRVPETLELQTAGGALRLPRRIVFLESGGHRPSSERTALNLAASGSCSHASEIPSARPCCPRRSALVPTFRSAPEFPRTWREGHGRPRDVESRSRT